VSGIPCVLYHVVAWEYVSAGSTIDIDFDLMTEEQRVEMLQAESERGQPIDSTRVAERTNQILTVDNGSILNRKRWVKRFEEIRSADFYLSDPQYPAPAGSPHGPQVFVPSRGEGGSDGNIRALDFHDLRRSRGRRGMLSVTFGGREFVIPDNITALAQRNGFQHSRKARRVMRYEERAFCVGDPIVLMGMVSAGMDTFARPMPCLTTVS
jgi:hypothetical protein